MRTILLLVSTTLLYLFANSQIQRKQHQAKRASSAVKIDGVLDDAAWKEITPLTNFVEQRPNPGKIEDYTNRTEIYILYDNTAIYVGGYCHEQTKDNISRELSGRDNPGVNDLVGILLDTYNDKINAVGFYVTPYGEQFDQKYLPPDARDVSWSAVWNSASKIHEDGWSFEIRIPYSALRFVSKDNQTWGMNFVRTRTKRGQQFTWNPIDPKVLGFVNQAGEWTGISKIEAPVRLSFSPYFSAYVNHYKPDPKDWKTSINGGMDVKYGISESFTLDMTLVPDFGQVQSDNQVLNLTPFEIRYNENRSFFTEGTELFNKGNLFYSRRIGGTPIHYNDVYRQAAAVHETVVKNPMASKLINATKISGRTHKGLGVGFFNAVTSPMYAELQDATGHSRKIETDPLTNYNIVVLDQNLKNNSSVSFINTNVLRSGSDYDANVTAGLFSINTKKNTYNVNGKFSVSHLTGPAKGTTGYAQTLGFNKNGGRWNFQLVQDMADDKYNINDMGLLDFNNFFNQYLWTGYKWVQPKDWYNRIQLNFNAAYLGIYKYFPNQKRDEKLKRLSGNINANAQFKNLWWAELFIGYIAEGNDFYEPRFQGWSFRTPERFQYSATLQTNSAKKYYTSLNYFGSNRRLFIGRSHEINYYQRYRFSDKFSVAQSLFLNPFKNDAGFYTMVFVNGSRVLKDIIFSQRDRMTVENILETKYNFNNRSGLTFRARHYWSKVRPKQLYDLMPDGTLKPTSNNIAMQDQNFNIFNIDAAYTWQFAPGSFINIVWKDQGLLFNSDGTSDYFNNIDRTLSEPQSNNLSIKVIYYLDYLAFKKRK
ncbi:MAG TPA: DUF5916 domain-containing protein [Ferruginibacter sp.]|nr:DUF5916 domain-containing protein [Ferruginibacter sp.]